METTTPTTELLEPSPAATASAVSTPLDVRAWLEERVDGVVCAAVAGSWFVLTQVIDRLEPATSRPEPVIGVLLQIAMWLLLATMVTGLVMQRRFGLVASLGAAVLATAAAIACPLSGHHQFGNWWFGEMVCVLALVAVSVIALRRHPSAPSEPSA
jgi:hypothetical protein